MKAYGGVMKMKINRQSNIGIGVTAASCGNGNEGKA
jgi:hypothetical protein